MIELSTSAYNKCNQEYVDTIWITQDIEGKTQGTGWRGRPIVGVYEELIGNGGLVVSIGNTTIVSYY